MISLAVEPGGRAALAGDWGLMAWLGWLFLVLFGSLCAFTMCMQLVRDWGPSRAGTYAFVSPIVAVLLGSAVLGERLSLLEGLGMAAMLAGAWLSLVSPRPRPVAASSQSLIRLSPIGRMDRDLERSAQCDRTR